MKSRNLLICIGWYLNWVRVVDIPTRNLWLIPPWCDHPLRFSCQNMICLFINISHQSKLTCSMVLPNWNKIRVKLLHFCQVQLILYLRLKENCQLRRITLNLQIIWAVKIYNQMLIRVLPWQIVTSSIMEMEWEVPSRMLLQLRWSWSYDWINRPNLQWSWKSPWSRTNLP